MRFEALLVFALGAGCALSLDGDRDAAPTADAVPVLASCAAFGGDPQVLGATGRVSSWVADGGTFFLADSLRLASGAIEPAVFANGANGAGVCLGSVAAPPGAPALDTTPLGPGVSGQLLSPFVAGGQRYAYLQASQGLNPVGIGLAVWDDAQERFVAPSSYLFTADRPAFGDAVLVEGDEVYAYGCKPTGFLTDSCYLARVAAASLGDQTAYEFYRSGGDFGPSIDDAWPLFTGGGGLAVVARGARVYAAYATPLGDTITVRSGLGPMGPWSEAIEVGRCDVPANAWCTAFAAHPQLDDDPATLSLTYAVASFDALDLAASLTRFARVPLGALP